MKVTSFSIAALPQNHDASTCRARHDGTGCVVGDVLSSKKMLFQFSDASVSVKTASPAVMPSFPKSLAAVRAAVASLLRPADHSGSLYSADDIADALNIAANVDGSASISTKVDVTLLLRAFANDTADEFVLAYAEHFCRDQDRNVLYIRRMPTPGRRAGKHLLHVEFGRSRRPVDRLNECPGPGWARPLPQRCIEAEGF